MSANSLHLWPLQYHQYIIMATQTQWAAAVQEGKDLWAKLLERLAQAQPQDSDFGDLLVEEE